MTDTQTSITERIAYVKHNQVLPHLREVTAEVPCFYCPESIATHNCDVNGCPKLTAWLTE